MGVPNHVQYHEAILTLKCRYASGWTPKNQQELRETSISFQPQLIRYVIGEKTFTYKPLPAHLKGINLNDRSAHILDQSNHLRMAAQPQPHTGQSRVPSPTPTAADAQGDIYLSRRRLRHLTALNADAEIVNLLQQWEDPASPTKFQDCGAIAAAIKNGHKQLLKYLEDRGFSLFESGAVNAACDYAVCSGDLDFLNSLVEQGWDPNVTDSGKSRLELMIPHT